MQNGSKVPLIIGVLVVVAIAGGALLASNQSDDTDMGSTTSSQTQSQSTPTQSAASSTMAAKNTIVDVAAGNTMFSTLVTAVKAADLVSTLSDTSKQYTVFAPTNDAFNKLPAGTVDTLVMPENKAKLSGILTYHVVEGKVMASQLTNGQSIKTVNGANLTVSIMDNVVSLTDVKGGKATVTKADVGADNGVVHVIDTVLMP